MKIGYVGRVNPRDPSKHVVLATQFYKPAEFAVQINLSHSNMWGVLKMVIDLVMKQPGGKYVLLRDPNKPLLRLYSVPMSSFEDSDEEFDGEEDESDGGDIDAAELE